MKLKKEGRKMKREKSIIFFGIIGSLLLLAMGFLPFFSLSIAQPSKDVKTLKVGCTLPLNTGMGVETKKMLEVIVPKFNDAGDLIVKGQRYQIDLIIYDDKYSAESGRAAVERLVHQDKVKFMICQIGSAPIVAGLSTTESEKVMNMVGGASPKIVSPKNQYIFGTSTTRTSIPPLWTMVKKVFPNAKTVVFISPDDETGRARAKEETQVAEAFGVKVLQVLHYPRDTVDFSSIAAKAKSFNSDLIDYPGAVAGTQFGLQLKAMYGAGFRGGHVSAITPQMDEITAVASNEALEGLLCTMQGTEVPSPSPLAREVKQDYMKKYGKWSEASLTWIPAWYAFIQAIKKADSLDPVVVANLIATKGLEWEIPNGKAMLVKRPDLENNKYCDTCSELAYAQIKSGKLAYIGRTSLDETVSACEKVFGGKWR
jgi:ABC-type branched-subunit amino acid transport system substrate-binding protein